VKVQVRPSSVTSGRSPQGPRSISKSSTGQPEILYSATSRDPNASTMRLRLTVQRNNIPAANILWNVPETNSPQAYTITRLLEDVNHVIPLEAEHWGLEHYVVEVGGFECLHFSPVAQALKDDDHVW
jgi:hypothetical protein